MKPRILHRSGRRAFGFSWKGPGSRTGSLLLAGFLGAACTAGPDRPGPFREGPTEMASPAPMGSGQPNLSVDDQGRVFLTWFESTGAEAYALRFSSFRPGPDPSWSPSGTIAEGLDFFVNWADFPSLLPLPGGGLVAHWLERSGPGTFHYDVVLSRSDDGGKSWSAGVRPHRDGTLSEHGFVSLLPWGEAEVGAVWLDGRKYETQPENPEMTLRFTTFGPEGLGPEVLLDDRVCECCQTSAARTRDGVVVVYRNRSPEEVRDISVLRYSNGSWSASAPLHRDEWEIRACPVNGPMVAAVGDRVAAAWFTAADDRPRVRAAFSEDGGASFGEPVRVDDGAPVGRVATVLVDGGALVSWLERRGEVAEVRTRFIGLDGRRGPAATVAVSSEARASGFPRMVRSGEHVVFAWTDAGDDPRVRVATARLDAP